VLPDYILHMKSLEEDVRLLLEDLVLTLVSKGMPDYILHMESLEEDVRLLLKAVMLTLVF
jgi:hypothetical protein